MMEPDDHPIRPALAVLQADQRALIRDVENPRYAGEHHLRDGFPHRRAVIEWYQRAIVRTLGHIADRVEPSHRSLDDAFMAAAITGPERTVWLDDPYDPATAREIRRRFEAEFVLPACNRAYNELREVAGEYLDEHDGPAPRDLDPADQQNIAMRPAFREIDVAQATALRTLWGGFESRDAVLDWIHGLDEPTNGAIRDDLGAITIRDRTAMGHLLETDDEATAARRFREWYAMGMLLPAFVAGVRDLSAGEMAARVTQRQESTPA